jgi:hypothetical protein
MLSPGSPSGLDREEAMRLLGELERLRRRGPALLDRLEHLTRQLRAIVSELKATLH